MDYLKGVPLSRARDEMIKKGNLSRFIFVQTTKTFVMYYTRN